MVRVELYNLYLRSWSVNRGNFNGMTVSEKSRRYSWGRCVAYQIISENKVATSPEENRAHFLALFLFPLTIGPHFDFSSVFV